MSVEARRPVIDLPKAFRPPGPSEVIDNPKSFLPPAASHPAPAAADGERVAREPERPELAKKADPMPESPQEPYRPHAGFLNRLQSEPRTFYCVFRDCTWQGFPYAHYDGIRLERSGGHGGGLDVVVRFSGSVVEEVRLSGRHLRFVAECIGLGIMPWVWELPDGRAAGDDDATVITGVTVTPIER